MTHPDPLMDAAAAALFLLLVTGAALLLSSYIHRVFSGGVSAGLPGAIERTVYRFIGTTPEEEEGWRGYTRDLLIFNGIGFVVLFALLLLQGALPLNPGGVGAFDPLTAVNAAVSFVTNTNWQVYSGEVSASYLSQMAGFTVQNFLSAATGICIAIAVMRGLTSQSTDRIGNFWVDMTRSVLYILLPLALTAALLLASQGVIQNLDASVTAGPQTIAMGPVASQEAIKLLGTNGGGFFAANSAHPYENPTAISNLIEAFLILLVPAALPFVFGRMTGAMRQGWAIYAVMLTIYVAAFGGLYAAELAGNPLMGELGVSGISMEGKEVRFGLLGTALFATSTTATSCGAVDAMHDSLTPLGGMVPMLLILLGEVVFGGVGSGFYTVTGFVVVAVFIAGLMIGRTPEFLGKKIEAAEMQMAVVTVLVPGVLVLLLSGITLALPWAMGNPGPHGLSEVVYAFASMSNNNGSAFAGLDATGPFYVIAGALAMAVGRFAPAIAMLVLAGSMAEKKAIPPGPGTLSTASPAFVAWTTLIILLVGGLTFFPLLAMGPVAEYLLMVGGV
ncbi:potassium-transporting ATPase subunit KdpA [Methanoculleus sp. UBA303]|uniref:potassium-transporting ATPase subunit KdpA n=1 Tax=Methanoculleus sp. UBA303 TaxID=1915497 RepID=UPI0025E50648|nr:potassium-transporting ATPase subunit KdpA [Methanoculleus sp. UBA303]